MWDLDLASYGVVGIAMIFNQLAVGVLHYTNPAGGVSQPLVVQFPPIGGDEVAVLSVVAAKV